MNTYRVKVYGNDVGKWEVKVEADDLQGAVNSVLTILAQVSIERPIRVEASQE